MRSFLTFCRSYKLINNNKLSFDNVNSFLASSNKLS